MVLPYIMMQLKHCRPRVEAIFKMSLVLWFGSFLFAEVHLLIAQYKIFSKNSILTLCLLVLSFDDLCKQFGSRSGPMIRQTNRHFCQAGSGSKLFDTLMVFLKYFFLKKVFFLKKNQQTTNKHAKIPSRQRVKQ